MWCDRKNRCDVVAEAGSGMTLVMLTAGAIALVCAAVHLHRRWRRLPNRRARRFRSFWRHFQGSLLPGTIELLSKTDDELEDYLRHTDREPLG